MATVGATEKQLFWVKKCLAERQVPEYLATKATGPLSKKGASELLSELFKCPKAQAQHEQTALAEPGYYVVENETGHVAVYVVVEGKTGRRVAKRLVLPYYSGGRAKWVYAKGMVYKLAQQSPLTVQEAASFGHLHGYCVCCGAALDKPLSVEAGIGPVCVKKHFGMTQMQFLAKKGA